MPTNRLYALQLHLQGAGYYSGVVDGRYGPLTRAAILLAFRSGSQTPLTDADYVASGARLTCPPGYVKAFASVEANGSGFFGGEPKILFEPHRFSKLTGGRFDGGHPAVSYPHWGERPYPPTQAGRYAQLLEAIGLDPDAGFKAASYGKFQIMGENAALCGYPGDPWLFAFAMAKDEQTQLAAFEMFITATGILPYLRGGMWTEVARRYNGSAFAKNQYDVRLAKAARGFAGMTA